jgi:hypothetical protein
MRGLQHDDASRHCGGEARSDQTGAGARSGRIAEKFRIVEEADVGRPGHIKRRDIADAPIGRVAVAQLGAR